MKLIKYTSVLLCFLMVAAMFACCDTPEGNKVDVSKNDTGENISEISEESKHDTVSKDYLLQNSEDVSEETSEELTFIIENRYPDGYNTLEIEEFFQDNEWVYVFPSPISSYVIVVYSDGTEQGIKEALAEGRVKVTDLDKFDIFYGKEPIEE